MITKNIKLLGLREDQKAKSKSFYLKNPYKKFDNKYITFLKNYSKKHRNCDVRICIHHRGAKHHDMIIMQTATKNYYPHKHIYCGDTYHVLDGKMACFLFTGKGKIYYSCIIEKNEIFKTPSKVYHLSIPITKYVIYHESKSGIFHKKSSVYTNWFKNKNDYKIFINKCLDHIKNAKN